MERVLTRKRLIEVLRYDKDRGLFFWKIAIGRRRKGSKAGHLNLRGYIEIRIDGKKYQAHRLAWFYVKGKWPKDQIDHANGKRRDNRFSNLREATQAQNSQNEHFLRANNTSGIQNVFWVKARQRWLVRIVLAGKRIYVGHFEDIDSAAEASRKAKMRFHPFHKKVV